jgi:hypothetical protein
MGLRVFKLSIILLIVYIPIHIAVFFAAPGPVFIGDLSDEMAVKGLIYDRQAMVADMAIEYLDVAVRALQVEAEVGRLRGLNELVGGEERWRSELTGRVNRIESRMDMR